MSKEKLAPSIPILIFALVQTQTGLESRGLTWSGSGASTPIPRIMCCFDPVVRKTFRASVQPSKNGTSLTLCSALCLSPSICLSVSSWLSYLLILFRNAVHCVTGLWLIACQFQLWHIRAPSPPRTDIKAVTVGSFYCSHGFHTARLSVSQLPFYFVTALPNCNM